MTEVGRQMAEVRDRRSEYRAPVFALRATPRHAEVRGQKTDNRGQKAEVGDQMTRLRSSSYAAARRSQKTDLGDGMLSFRCHVNASL